MTIRVTRPLLAGDSKVYVLNNYGETYAPVARLESIRILPAYANHHDITLYQMDIKSAILNGEIEEEVYVKQPPGFVNPKKPNHVYKLHKALYGLTSS